MPNETPAPGEQQQSVDQILQNIVNEHPQLAEPTRQGGMTRDYNPVNLPNDDTAQSYYRAHVPEGQPEPTSPPPAAGQTPTPAPAGQTPEPQPGGLVFGKYKSIDEANSGYWKLVDELKTRDAENRALKAVNLHLEQVFGGFRQERPEPTPQHIPVQLLPDQTPVIPMDRIRETTDARAAQIARETVTQILGPLQALSGAQARVSSEYPEFNTRQSEFSTWLNLNPTYQERAARDPEGGLELAWLRFQNESAQRRQSASAQTTTIAQQQVTQARSQAGAVANNGGGGATRRTTDVQARANQLNELWNYGQQTGDWKPYKNFRTAEALGDSFLNDLDRTNWGTR